MASQGRECCSAVMKWRFGSSNACSELCGGCSAMWKGGRMDWEGKELEVNLGMRCGCGGNGNGIEVIWSWKIAEDWVWLGRCGVGCGAGRGEDADVGLDGRGVGKMICGLIAGCAAALVTCGEVQAISANNLLFLEAWRAVDRAYVDRTFNGENWFKVREDYLRKVPMDTQAETYDAIKSLLGLLEDPFTSFFEPSRFSALRGGTAGSVIGVGIEVGYEMGLRDAARQMMVIAPAPGSPAAKAGVSPGDALVAIDGALTADLTLYEASEKLQGEVGSEVTLDIRTQNEASRQVLLKRERVTFNPVSYGLCDAPASKVNPNGSDHLGYLRISRFTKQAPVDTGQALRDLKAGKADSLLVDLRNNGGGSFAAGIEIARMLLGAGDIVLIADSDGVRDIISTEGFPIDDEIPMTVLVNKGTASASEVFSGAIQDNGRGSIVGETTFGKGLIQTVIPLSDGSGITITASKYQTPNGRDINKIGIQPDIEVPQGILPDEGDSKKVCQALQSENAPQLFLKK